MREPRSDTSDDATGLRGQVRDHPLPTRWPLNLDVFWPILAVVLAVAVVFVASVAHSSMNSVGVLVLQTSVARPTPVPTASPTGPIMVVQASSHSTRSAAQAACEELIRNGYKARVLDSDGYRPLNRGYYVAVIGPYPATAAGLSAAKKVQGQLKGALVRTLRPR